MTQSQYGRAAVPFQLPDTAGKIHRLEDYAGRWLLLVFHRHLGWLPCREHLAQLRQQEASLASLGAAVVVITFQSGPLVDAYVRDTELSWPILVDESLALYQAYGMERGKLWDVWGPPAWAIYFKLFLRGRRLVRTEGDVNQLGGDVLIDPQGIVRLHHIGRGPADRPAVEDLLRIIRDETVTPEA